MNLQTQITILQDLGKHAPRAMRRKDFEEYLESHRDVWRVANDFRVDDFITLLLENGIVKVATIHSDSYDPKSRYLLGDASPLQLACSFYQHSYLSHGTALGLHGLSNVKSIFVNHEQSLKKTTSRLTQSGLDIAFRNGPRKSSYVFRYGSQTITFLNGKNTGRAGIIEMKGPDDESLMVSNFERTLIDVVVRPQYAGGIRNVVRAFEKAKDRISVQRIATLLKQVKYVYPYHQALGFILQRVGVREESLVFLREQGIRFKFYLAYGMRSPAFDPLWKIYYPSDL